MKLTFRRGRTAAGGGVFQCLRRAGGTLLADAAALRPLALDRAVLRYERQHLLLQLIRHEVQHVKVRRELHSPLHAGVLSQHRPPQRSGRGKRTHHDLGLLPNVRAPREPHHVYGEVRRDARQAGGRGVLRVAPE